MCACFCRFVNGKVDGSLDDADPPTMSADDTKESHRKQSMDERKRRSLLAAEMISFPFHSVRAPSEEIFDVFFSQDI